MKLEYITYQFLVKYFTLFGADIDTYYFTDGIVNGTIIFKDDNEKQEFRWTLELDENVLVRLIILCDYLIKNHLINGDKIRVSEIELTHKLCDLNWRPEDSNDLVNKLMSVSILMIDDGEENDSFFLHF